MLVNRVLGTLANVVDDGACSRQVARLDEGLGTHEHHVGVAEHVVVHGERLPRAVVGLALRALRHFLHRCVVAVGIWGAAVGLGESVVRLILVGECRHAHGVEQARVPLLCCRLAVHGIVDGLVVVVELRQSVLRLEGVDKILRRLVEVPSARPHAPSAVEHVAPVGASVGGVVVLVVGSLHGEDALFAVGVLGEEDVAVVLKVAVVGVVLHDGGILQHLLHVVLVDVRVAVGLLVAVAIGKGEVALGEIRRCGNLCDAVLVLLHVGQCVVCFLEVIDNLLEEFLVGELVVTGLFLQVVGIYVLVNPRHLAEHGDELEVEVGAEELHLCHTLLRCLSAKFVVAVLVEREQGAVATADGAVETVPQFVELARR